MEAQRGSIQLSHIAVILPEVGFGAWKFDSSFFAEAVDRLKTAIWETGTFEPAAEWRRAEKVFTVNHPDRMCADLTVAIAQENAPSADSQVWFDDVRLERLSEEGIDTKE